MPRPRCGNDPRAQLTPADRQAIADFRAYLTRRAQEKTMPDVNDSDGLARKLFLAETEAVREHLAEQEQDATTRAEAALAPLEAKARALREQQRARHRAEVLREAADGIEDLLNRREAEERDRHGFLDHETELQGGAVRDVIAHLRARADYAQQDGAQP